MERMKLNIVKKQQSMIYGRIFMMFLLVGKVCGGFFLRADTKRHELDFKAEPFIEAVMKAISDSNGRLGRMDLCQCKTREKIYRGWNEKIPDRDKDLLIVELSEDICQNLDLILEETERMVHAQYGDNTITIPITLKELPEMIGIPITDFAKSLIKECKPDVSSCPFDIVDASVIAQYCLRKYEYKYKPDKQVDFHVILDDGSESVFLRLPILAAYAYIRALSVYIRSKGMKVTDNLQIAIDTKALGLMRGLFFMALEMRPLIEYTRSGSTGFANRYGSYYILAKWLKSNTKALRLAKTESLVALQKEFTEEEVNEQEADVKRQLIEITESEKIKETEKQPTIVVVKILPKVVLPPYHSGKE